MKNTRKAVIEDLPQLAELFDQYRIFYHMKSDIPVAGSFLKERITHRDSEIFISEENGKLTIIPDIFIHKNAALLAAERPVCQ